MKNLLILIRNGAFAVAIAVALSLGAAEALSGTPDLSSTPCDTPNDICDDNLDCYDWCPIGGTCFLPFGCCGCFE